MPNNDYYLIDLSDKDKSIQRNRAYDLIANLCLRYGFPGSNFSRFTDQLVFKEWKYGRPYPNIKSFRHFCRTKHIKWYIQNKIEWNDKIWNGSFLRGLARHGTIIWNKYNFPNFVWYQNDIIEKLIKSCPFGGDISFYRHCTYTRFKRYKWRGVPALYLPNDESSISYLAGFLSAARLYSNDGVDYAAYPKKSEDYLKSIGIPIESHARSNEWALISPFWPALFTLNMPECVRETWTKLKNPCNANFYAPILWKTYIDNNFRKNGIPYLQSRRTIFYKFKSEIGATENIDRLRVEKDLVSLDYRIRDIVKLWNKEDTNEEIKDEQKSI